MSLQITITVLTRHANASLRHGFLILLLSRFGSRLHSESLLIDILVIVLTDSVPSTLSPWRVLSLTLSIAIHRHDYTLHFSTSSAGDNTFPRRIGL